MTYQLLGGMAGFLIVKGGPGTLDAVPEVAAAKDVLMGFQVIRTLIDGTQAFVHQEAEQFGTFPFGTTDESSRASGAPTASTVRPGGAISISRPTG